MRYILLHLGIPLGWVDLPEGRLWAGGILDAETSYEGLRPSLAEITRLVGRDAVGLLLKLSAGDRPRLDDLSPDAAAALERAAEMDFELRTPSGARVAADVVRVVDLGNGTAPRVAAQFRVATADSQAWLPDQERHGGGDHDAGV